MRLRKFSHSCVRLEADDRALVLDPGLFSEAADALDGAGGVLISHEHPDHVDPDAIRAAAQANSSFRVWAPAVVAATFADLGDQVVTTAPGESFDAVGFSVETFGGQHALIHPQIPTIANVAYLIDGEVFHPGDSFTLPTKPVSTLLVPLHAPWSKVSEVIDFVTAVRAPRAFQIHDALLNDAGAQLVTGLVNRFAPQYGTEFRRLDALESVDL